MIVHTVTSKDAPMPSSPPRSRPVRILLVEDHDMVAEAICLALERSPVLEIVGRAASLASARVEARRHEPAAIAGMPSIALTLAAWWLSSAAVLR
ncbi:hypothetical protein ABZS78_39920, partial [Streptomyces decoyicus]